MLCLCCDGSEADAVADVGADTDTLETLCRLGLVARFCGETTYQKLAESHLIGNVDMLQQDYDKSRKLNELCERTVAIDPCQTRLPQNATIAYTSGLIG